MLRRTPIERHVKRLDVLAFDDRQAAHGRPGTRRDRRSRSARARSAPTSRTRCRAAERATRRARRSRDRTRCAGWAATRPGPEIRSSSAGETRTGNHGDAAAGSSPTDSSSAGSSTPRRHAIGPRRRAVRRRDAAGSGRCDESERRRGGCRCRRWRRRRTARAAGAAAPRCRGRSPGRRQHEAEAAAAARQRDRALDEQLIAVRVAVRLRAVDAGVAREPQDRRHVASGARERASAAPVSARIMSHGGLPMTASKPARGRRAAVAIEEHLRELELPVKEPPRLADGVGRVEIPAGDRRRQRAAPGQDRVRQRRRTPTRARRRPPAGTTRRTRDRRSASTATRRPSGPSARPAHAPSRAPAPACRWASSRARTAPAAPRAARSSIVVVVEQRQGASAPRAPARVRRVPQVGEPRAEQAVADLEVVIEKAQRPIGRQRREPERQPRELDGHRVQVDAVQASLGDRSPDGDPVRVADVARVAAAGANERGLVRGREIPAGGDEKRAAAHRRIDHAQLQDAFGRRVAHERCERPPDEVVGDRLRRVERPGRLANDRIRTRAVTLPARRRAARSRATSRTPRRAARRRGRGRRCARVRRDRQRAASTAPRTARLAASSSRSRRSASGVRAGANRRPLNGVTRRSPARHPAWASRAIARSASHSPVPAPARSAMSRSASRL